MSEEIQTHYDEKTERSLMEYSQILRDFDEIFISELSKHKVIESEIHHRLLDDPMRKCIVDAMVHLLSISIPTKIIFKSEPQSGLFGTMD